MTVVAPAQTHGAPLSRTETLTPTTNLSSADPSGAAPSGAAKDRKAQARLWAERLADYKTPVARRSIGQLASTLLPLAGLVAAMGYALEVGYWLSLLLAVPAALFLTRLFVLQHDCGHGSFFKEDWANNLVGRCLSVFTVTPYEVWRRDHAIHHATSGNLDKRGTGDINTLTVREYLALSRWQRFLYRTYRHPLVLFGIGPTVLFMWKFRFPLSGQERDVKAWISVLSTNVMIGGGLTLFMLAFGALQVLMIWAPVVILAATIGIWLFYVQHQFENVYWRKQKEWDFHEAAIEGCSFYDLPRWLHWITGYIGYHHVHHLASRVPNYRLRDCHLAIQDFHKVAKLGIWESFATVKLALIDEDNHRMIGFRDLRAAA